MSERMAPRTINVFVIGRVLFAAAAADLPFEPIFRLAGITPEDLARREKRIPVETVDRLWEHVVEASGDRGIVVRTATNARLEHLHVMGFSIMTSPDGREAIRRLIRYFALLTNAEQWRLEEEGDIGRLWFERSSGDPGRSHPRSLGYALSMESVLSACLHLVRQTSGDDGIVPITAYFDHQAPDDLTAHRAFFRCPLKFEAGKNGFVFPKTFLELVPRNANAALSAFFEDHAESLLSKLYSEQETVSQRIRGAIARSLASGSPSMAAVAREHGTSERSLRRALAAEETSFRKVVDEVRLERAEELLARGDVSMTDVAFLLGFSDLSAFSRAFKRARGVAPKAYSRTDPPPRRN